VPTPPEAEWLGYTTVVQLEEDTPRSHNLEPGLPKETLWLPPESGPRGRRLITSVPLRSRSALHTLESLALAGPDSKMAFINAKPGTVNNKRY
jgi:hypothetical protein